MKNIVIVGVTGGLGSCLAKEYLDEGCQVFGFDIDEGDNCSCLQNERFSFGVMDIASDSSVSENAEKLCRKISHIDILIHCAGILPQNSERQLEDFEVSEALEVFNTNALGPLRVTKMLLRLVKASDAGVIVNISSEAGSMQAHADYIIRYDYCMSKAALNIQSIILQRYLEKDKIRVLAVHPGWMQTKMGGQEAPLKPSDSAKQIKRLITRHQYDYHNRVLMDYNDKIRPW